MSGGKRLGVSKLGVARNLLLGVLKLEQSRSLFVRLPGVFVSGAGAEGAIISGPVPATTSEKLIGCSSGLLEDELNKSRLAAGRLRVRAADKFTSVGVALDLGFEFEFKFEFKLP